MESGATPSPSVSSSPLFSSTTASTPPEIQPVLENCSKPNLQSSQSAYARWRSSYHLQPLSGWLNDPCAPFYNTQTGLYHVSFQWNPNGPDWGDICWGTATSPDLVHWDMRPTPILEPGTEYDCEGVFTGCIIPSNTQSTEGEGLPGNVLTVAYTSVKELPIHHTLPHVRGSESISLARSFDAGKTWQKNHNSLILPHEPNGLNVTGWRDPFVAPWRAMSELLSLDPEETLFGVVSGGIRDITPTTFLYAISRQDVSLWKCIGPLVDVGCNARLSRWSGDLGKNWEVVNFMTLKDEGDKAFERHFLLMGTEGCLPSSVGPSTGKGISRPERGQLWMSGALRRNEAISTASPVTMAPSAVGYIDHGCLYAANSFHDPISDTQIIWGWITEDDLCDELRHAQGWSGLLSLPRELRVQTLKHVICARANALHEITSIEVEQQEQAEFDGTSTKLWTIRTLASEPLERVVHTLRSGPNVRCWTLGKSSLRTLQQSLSIGYSEEELQTSTWELSCSIKVSSSCRNAGFVLAHASDLSSRTTLAFSPYEETFMIHRPYLAGPGSDELINAKPEVAAHTLFTLRDPNTGLEEEENLNIRAWRDNSVLEVFVNGRTAISTRIYGAEASFGLFFFANDADDTTKSELLSATLWDGIGV